jgi:hypothetical protein
LSKPAGSAKSAGSTRSAGSTKSAGTTKPAASDKRSREEAIQAEKWERYSQYFEALGVKTGAALEDLNTAYYTLIKRFPENPTEDEEERLHKVMHAYGFLCRAYAPSRRQKLVALMKPKILVPVLGTLSAIAIAILVAMNYQAIKLQMTFYDNGTELRFKNQAEPFGRVVAYESQHQFPTGNPSPAYGFRKPGEKETVWISQRLVVSGMVPTSSP